LRKIEKLKMPEFLNNFFRLTRPLSNTKNILLLCLVFFLLRPEINWLNIILSIFSLSLISSAIYAFNSFCDFKVDKDNKNKEHYSKAIKFFGGEKISFIVTLFIFWGLFLGLMINYYFLFCLVLLLIFNFFYSSCQFRFKEKIIIDALIAGIFTFALRFIALWFVFAISFPPILAILALISAKSGGYLLYKEMDRDFLIKQNIRNTITIFKRNTIVLVSGLLYFLAIISADLMCFNERYFKINILGFLPFYLLLMLPLVLPPILILYLKVFNKINISGRNLRFFGFLYALLIVIILVFLI